MPGVLRCVPIRAPSVSEGFPRPLNRSRPRGYPGRGSDWSSCAMLLGIMETEGVPSQMASHSESEMGVNSWLEDELYQQYLRDRSTVDESWKHVFEEPRPQVNGTSAPALAPGEQLLPLRGAAGRIAENMAASVSI